MADEGKTEVAGENGQSLHLFLEQQIWPLIPADVIGTTITREQEDQILGYGPEGS